MLSSYRLGVFVCIFRIVLNENTPGHNGSALKVGDTTSNNIQCRGRRRGIKSTCWGYEHDCNRKDLQFTPFCTKLHENVARSLEEQAELFWNQADFGYISKMREKMLNLCKSNSFHGSWLKCTPDMVFCSAKNLVIDFSHLDFRSPTSIKTDIFNSGQIGGQCQLDKALLKKQNQMNFDLWSWYAELENYSSLDEFDDNDCDEVVSKPTIFVKLDSGFNMYHHFCDFINIYISQHINGSDFSTNVNIINWEVSSREYLDMFEETWRAFSKYPLLHLKRFKGKRVCFRDAFFSIPPRNAFTLYYNTPLVSDCYRSSLVRAFSEHILRRLNRKQEKYEDSIVRVTFLTRSTEFRKIINEDQLLRKMKKIKNVEVRKVDYNRHKTPFLRQLQITSNTDVFIGIHGAGLTHFLFLPDWASGFEVYNTEDAPCYHDLSRLRGIQYFTWEDRSKFTVHDKGKDERYGEYPKFWNYSFDVEEFVRIFKRAVKHVVKNRPKFDACT